MPAIDAETFRGKLYLLVIDKIVIGALIAVIFLVYDRWKTEEVRRYDETRQEVELGFRRAEYVKELVPIVVDTNRDVLVRAHAFAALVETKSISSHSTINFAQNLLLSDVLGVGRYTVTWVNPVNEEIHTYTPSPETEEDFLLATIIKVMPSGLPSVLKQYTHTVMQHRAVRDNDGDYEQVRILNDAMGFWIRLFRETVTRLRDSDLSLLNSEPFLVENLATLDAIVPTLSLVDAERWIKRRNLALRTLGFLRLASSREKAPAAIPFLKSVMNPKSGTHGLDFSSELIKLIHRDAVVLPELSVEALAVVLTSESLALRRTRLDEGRSPAEDHFHVAAEYLVWSGGFPQIVRAVEPSVLAELRKFRDRITAAQVESLDYNNYPVEWTLIRFLITSNSASNEDPSEGAQRLLSELFTMGEDKLERTGLTRYADEWQEAQR